MGKTFELCILSINRRPFLQMNSYTSSTVGQQGRAGKLRAGLSNDGFVASGVRSLSANLKYPYKRTISAPGGMGLSQKGVHSHPRGSLSQQMSTTTLGASVAGAASTSGGTGRRGWRRPRRS